MRQKANQWSILFNSRKAKEEKPLFWLKKKKSKKQNLILEML